MFNRYGENRCVDTSRFDNLTPFRCRIDDNPSARRGQETIRFGWKKESRCEHAARDQEKLSNQ